jgi:hypothetical protein
MRRLRVGTPRNCFEALNNDSLNPPYTTSGLQTFASRLWMRLVTNKSGRTWMQRRLETMLSFTY